MSIFKVNEITQMIEISAVRAYHSQADIKELIGIAKQYQCGVVQTLPAQTALARALITPEEGILVGGNIGFPSGAHSTTIKVAETIEMMELGCDEIDVVINLPLFLSGKYDYVLDDLRAVVNTAAGLPVKVIIETDYLTDDQIKKACDLLIEAGATYVKTSTGWTPIGATLEHIALIKDHVGDAVKIKASGGIRNLETILKFAELGVSRFGIGMKGGLPLLKELFTYPSNEIVFKN